MSMGMKDIRRIADSYFRYFKIKDVHLQFIMADDMYECQKKYGFSDEDVKSLDEATARHNWKYVAACMKYPKSMDEPFYLLFKKSYVTNSPEYELYRLVFHELTHMVDYENYARVNHLTSYAQLFSDPQAVLFQHWSEYHAERRGYGAWIKHRYGVRLKYDPTPEKIRIMEQETISNVKFYAEHYTNTAEYGSTRQIYFTMHWLARMSIWLQILPHQVSEILCHDPFNYRGVVWLKKLMGLFITYPELRQMNDHFMEIAAIIAENMALTKDQLWEIVPE